jgi:signal peptidase II
MRPPVKAPAFSSPGLRLAALGAASAVLAADQVSKSLVLAARPGTGSGAVSVRLVRNTGASFGVGAGHPIVVLLVSLAVVALAVALMIRTTSRAGALLLAVAVGGAAGNLADRLFRGPGAGRGAVIDWIHVAGYPATFNIADVAIRLGAIGAVAAMLGGTGHAKRWLLARRTRRDRGAAYDMVSLTSLLMGGNHPADHHQLRRERGRPVPDRQRHDRR